MRSRFTEFFTSIAELRGLVELSEFDLNLQQQTDCGATFQVAKKQSAS